MKFSAQFHGIPAGWVGTGSVGFRLSDDATYPDLIKAIKHRFGGNIPYQKEPCAYGARPLI
jgi:hypothetical protein